MSEPTLHHDAESRVAVITFPNGHKLTVKNVDKAKADDFFARHAKEFEKRDCVLHTSGTFEVRNHG